MTHGTCRSRTDTDPSYPGLMPDQMGPSAAFLDALGRIEAQCAPGAKISVEQVAEAAGLEVDPAIRVGMELIGAGMIEGRELKGDARIMTIHGLALTGYGSVELQQQRGLRFMSELARRGAGRTIEEYASTVGEALGWSPDETDAVAEMLVEDDLLIEVETGSDLITMSPDGRAELSAVVAGRAEPGSPIGSTINVFGNVIDSQLQAGTVGSTQQQVTFADQTEAISAFVVEMRAQMPHLDLDDDGRAVAEADLATVRAQLASPRPNDRVLHESLTTLRSIVEGVAGNFAYAGLLELFGHIHF